MINGYNTSQLDRLISLNKTCPTYAREEYEALIKKEPWNYFARIFYVANLITLGEFDLAEKTLKLLIEDYKNDEIFIKKTNTVNHLRRNIAYHALRLYSYQERYQDLYYTFLNNKDFFRDVDLRAVLLYSKRKSRPYKEIDKSQYSSYIFQQICDYSEEDCLSHIKKHLADFNTDLEAVNSNLFAPNFPIDEVYKEIKKNIPSKKRLCPGFYDNVYLFKYDSCGSDGTKMVDYFKVVCFHNTNNIITIVPTDKIPNWPYIDINHIKRNTPKGYNGMLKNHNFVNLGDYVSVNGEKYIVKKVHNDNKFSLLKIVDKAEREVSFKYKGKTYHVKKNAFVYDKNDIFIIESLGKEVLDAFEAEKQVVLDIEKRMQKRAYRIGDMLLVDYKEYVVIDIDGNDLILMDPDYNLYVITREGAYEITGLMSKKLIADIRIKIEYDSISSVANKVNKR